MLLDASSGTWIYLIAAAAGWVVAQLLKYIFYAYKTKNLTNISWLYQSGGMPSSHSAITVALATAIAYKDGVNSGLFAVAVILAFIVMYDAMQVRRSSGEQGIALRELLEKAKIIRSPHHALGHTPAEVATGAVIGIIIGSIVAIFIT